MIWFLTPLTTMYYYHFYFDVPFTIPKESYHQQILDNMRAEKELSENLLLLCEHDDGSSGGSESLTSDSDNDLLTFMLNDKVADKDLQRAERKIYLKEQ